MNEQDPATALYQALTQYTHAHRAAERADNAYQEEKQIFDRFYIAELDIAEAAKTTDNKPLHSNADKRHRAAITEIDRKHPGMRETLETLEQERTATARERDRLHESLKTYRELLRYKTAQLERETAEMDARTGMIIR